VIILVKAKNKKTKKKSTIKKKTQPKKTIKKSVITKKAKPKKTITKKGKKIKIKPKPAIVFEKRTKVKRTIKQTLESQSARSYYSKTKISYPSDFCKFDLHIHSKYSRDAVNEPETIIKKVKQAGLTGFAITDHNSIRAWPALARLAKENNLVFVPGQEIDVTFEGKRIGHLLALFTYDKITSTEILDVVDDARSQSALLSFPHPFDTGRFFRGFDYLMNNGPISRFVPAIETFNARVLTSRANEIAKDFAHKHGLLQTAGSDAHMPYEIGSGYVIAKAQTELELLKEIKLGRVVVNGELSGIKPRIHTLGAFLNILKERHFR